MYIVAGLVMLGVLVVVHEFGHFLLAKLFGIGVPVFSVGMGPRIGGFFWRGTDYRLSLLPIGGYVRMAGADPFGEEDPDSYVAPEEDFMRKPVWQRLLVMLAGPGFNLILPVVLFTGVLMMGEPQPDGTVGTVFDDTLAAEVGLEPHDRVIAVDGEPVEAWGDVIEPIADRRDVTLRVERGGAEPFDVLFPASRIPLGDDGKPELEHVGMTSARMSSRIGVDDPTSPAWRAGLRTGDAIAKVDGEPVADWTELRAALDRGPTHKLAVIRGDEASGEIRELEATLVRDPSWQPRAGEIAPDAWGILPATLFAGAVKKDTPAEIAGVLPNDRIFSVDGHPVDRWSAIVDLVGATVDEAHEDAQPRTLDLVVVREGVVKTLSFRPKIQREIVFGAVRYRPIMGIEPYPEAFVPGPETKKYYSFFEAVPRAVKETAYTSVAVVGMLASLITFDLKPQETLGGPIEIFRQAGKGMEQGLFTYVRLIGHISVSLAIFNLLPVPVLDGGQILFYSIEGIRGRPLSLALREKLQMAGVLALVALMLMVLVFDVNRWLTEG